MTEQTRQRSWASRWVPWLALTGLLTGVPSCGDDGPGDALTAARVVHSRADLIGGNRALGDVGDFLLENDQIRIVIQGPGFSRGFGVFGGNIIDADLRRPNEVLSSSVTEGNDSFSELFPAFFLEALATDTVEILSDGSDGGPARVRSSGYAGDFLTLVGVLNRAATGSHTDFQEPDSEDRLFYENIYELEPRARYLTIRFRVTNVTDEELTFPSEDATNLLGLLGLDLEGFTLPVGDVALFGDTSPAFAPGAGFDLRTRLEQAYDNPTDWPGFPGVVTDWVATRGSVADVSYGYLAAPSDANFAYNKRAMYETESTPVTRSSLLIPFVSASLMGIFREDAPAELAAGESFESVRYFVLGSGDVGSVLDVMNEIQNIPTGRFGGRVTDQVSGQPAEDASVIVYQRLDGGTRRIYSQYDVRSGGHFGGTLVPGAYSARVTGEGRPLSNFVDFDVVAGRLMGVELTAPSAARIVATVVDSQGRRLPAKVTVVGSYDAADSGRDPREFLFNLPAGEQFRWTDLIEDEPDDPDTRRYIEATAPTQDGSTTLHVRPGDYSVYVSRGIEYDVVRGRISVRAGETASVAATLRRVVDTRGWISGDMHVHSQNSIDAGREPDQLVRWMAAEGVEWAVSTDHNYITSLAPAIARNGLQPWLSTSIGIEMSTLESGHFNAYPLRYDPGPVTHGSFEWSQRPPDEIFTALRALGAYGPENTLVQINHPRDTIQGYFEQYRRDALTTEYVPPGLLDSFLASSGPAFVDENDDTTFSMGFDVIEILTGKRYDLLHHYRIPEVLPEGELPDDIPPAGTILLDEDGEVAFPGAVDDWYNLLNLGENFIAVGNSDSHEDEDEIGVPRNLIYMGRDDPQSLTEMEVIDALRSRRVVISAGPVVDFAINDGVIGSTITDADGTVELMLRVTAAPWVSVDRVHVVRNGLIARTVQVSPSRDLSAEPLVETMELELATNSDGDPIDSWFVIEVAGSESLFPIVLPIERPPLVLSDAVAGLGGAFGFGAAEFGDLKPPPTFPVTAYAITNPIWVTLDGDFTPPGVAPVVARQADGQNPFDVPAADRVVSPDALAEDGVRYVGTARPLRPRQIGLFQRDPNNPYDVRRVIEAFGGHGH